MKQSPQIKARVNALAKELANGKERAELLGKYTKKWGIARTSFDRYLKEAKEQVAENQKLASKIATETLISETQEAVKQGIKTKVDRILTLQKQVEEMEAELIAGTKPFYTGRGSKRKEGTTKMSPVEKSILRKTIRDVQAEISKIQGDYAPIKSANTDKDGNDVKVDISKLSDAALMELAKLSD